jgi:hypothetical protein
LPGDSWSNESLLGRSTCETWLKGSNSELRTIFVYFTFSVVAFAIDTFLFPSRGGARPMHSPRRVGPDAFSKGKPSIFFNSSEVMWNRYVRRLLSDPGWQILFNTKPFRTVANIPRNQIARFVYWLELTLWSGKRWADLSRFDCLDWIRQYIQIWKLCISIMTENGAQSSLKRRSITPHFGGGQPWPNIQKGQQQFKASCWQFSIWYTS